jgi:hypothetical protein
MCTSSLKILRDKVTLHIANTTNRTSAIDARTSFSKGGLGRFGLLRGG